MLRERGVDILYAALIFERPVLTRIDDRADYGEVRQIALGMVDGECFVVVFTDRDNVRRLITAWKGGRGDRSRYQEGVSLRPESDERSR
ncbi:BrnT family toxin [Aliirhizobium terrae]|uniref:BrnT family toxin n=1 Tax=Terrirhizobium terrae TaxID=2926709 RepID=UPI002576ED33|nr:BrnT family toxin [Rhizobium sp. CC-CFT758]WJH42259.1 BrnT family toxin [Rhizobium sp. CC-CFT758]